MKVRAVWQFFEAERDGNAIHLFEPGGAARPHVPFGRQRARRRPLPERLHPEPEDQRDHIALFVVTAGEGIREMSEQWKQAGEFFKAHALQALAIETAEGMRRVAAPPHPRGLGFPRSRPR